MTRYLLDTNIISNLVKPTPSETLLAWMAVQRDDKLFIASLTVAEIRRGILEKPEGRKRDELERWFLGPEGPQVLFSGRILPFDDKAGIVWAKLMADGKRAGQPRSGLDMIIGAIASTNDCIIVTDNERDFRDLGYINPLRERQTEELYGSQDPKSGTVNPSPKSIGLDKFIAAARRAQTSPPNADDDAFLVDRDRQVPKRGEDL